MAVSVSLQSGNAGYNKEFQGIKRDIQAKFGPGKGALTSAFRPDGGSEGRLDEAAAAADAELDRRGMILNLMYFYQGRTRCSKTRRPSTARRATPPTG